MNNGNGEIFPSLVAVAEGVEQRNEGETCTGAAAATTGAAAATGGGVVDDNEGVTGPQEIESLCMNCGGNGVTRLLLTRIPFFREVVLMSFSCPHCGFRNSEIEPAATIAEQGCRYKHVKKRKAPPNCPWPA